jgi:hypothetical protein
VPGVADTTSRGHEDKASTKPTALWPCPRVRFRASGRSLKRQRRRPWVKLGDDGVHHKKGGSNAILIVPSIRNLVIERPLSCFMIRWGILKVEERGGTLMA